MCKHVSGNKYPYIYVTYIFIFTCVCVNQFEYIQVYTVHIYMCTSIHKFVCA